MNKKRTKKDQKTYVLFNKKKVSYQDSPPPLYEPNLKSF